MPFKPQKTRNKVESVYKSIYLKRTTIEELDKLAAKYHTSFNNIVVTMVEDRLEELRKEEGQD